MPVLPGSLDLLPVSFLHQQRCFHHASREAAARCLECQRFFCRECITEHDDRVICTACLARVTTAAHPGRRRWTAFARFVPAVLGIFLAWLCFHAVALVLMKIPSDFHAGTIWKASRWEPK